MLSGTPTPNPPVGLTHTRATWAAYLLLGLFAYLETAVGPSMPFLRADLGLDYTVASLHFTAFAAGGAVAGLTAEHLVRQCGRARLLWGGIAGMTAGAALLATSPTVAGTITGIFAMGALGTLFLVTDQASLADLHGERRTVALAESNVVASAAAITAPLAVGAFAASGLGWSFGLLAAIPLFAVLALRFRTVSFPTPVSTTTHDRAQRLPRAFWLIWTVMFLVASVEWCVAYWGADFLATVVGLHTSTAATAMSVFFAAMVAGRFAGARLAQRYASTTLLVAALLVAIAGFPVFWLVHHPIPSLAGLFVAGVGIANLYPLTVAAATDLAPHLADRATARLAIAGAAALMLAPLLVGVLADAVGMRWAFGVVLPLALTATVTTIVATRSAPPIPATGVAADSHSPPTSHDASLGVPTGG
jgi:MFS family permease